MRNTNEIQTVDILDTGEQIAFVMTSIGSYIVTPVPDAFTDLHDVTILQKVDSIDEATLWLKKQFRATPGRPPFYGEKMRQTAIWLPDEMIAWLKTQPGSISETIRSLVEQAMK